jgi:hypothetical protein
MAKSLFEVNGKNKYENNKKMTISVYGVRTFENNSNDAEFLVYYNGNWIWKNAKCYTPIDNKHS